MAIQLTSLGIFAGPLALTYGPLPHYATATIAPTTVTLAAGGTGSSTLTLNTLQHAENVVPEPGGPRSSRTQRAMNGPPGRRWPGVVAASVLVLWFSRKRRMSRVLGVVLLAVMLQTLSGCVNAWYRDEVVASGSYIVGVTATDVSGNTQTATVTVVITP